MDAICNGVLTRRCRLAGIGTGITNASLDILYIEVTRRWENENPDRPSGELIPLTFTFSLSEL